MSGEWKVGGVLTIAASVVLEVTVTVVRIVDVDVDTEVFAVPSKQEQALLIFNVRGFPVPQPAPDMEGIVGAALF